MDGAEFGRIGQEWSAAYSTDLERKARSIKSEIAYMAKDDSVGAVYVEGLGLGSLARAGRRVAS